MGTITTFDHTADVGMTIRGSDLDDLFRTAAEGLFDYIVVNRDAVQPLERESLSVAADSTAELLVAWLNELIFRSETQHRLYNEFLVRVSPDALHLTAELAGEPIDRSRHILDHEVKAVTHHGLTLRQEATGWVAEVVLDI